MLYCTVLYCTVLYCTVLYCTVLYCTVLYSRVKQINKQRMHTRNHTYLHHSTLLGKFKKVVGAKGKRRNLAKAEAGRYGIMVGPRVELRMRSRGGKDSVLTSLVWHHKVRRWLTLELVLDCVAQQCSETV